MVTLPSPNTSLSPSSLVTGCSGLKRPTPSGLPSRTRPSAPSASTAGTSRRCRHDPMGVRHRNDLDVRRLDAELFELACERLGRYQCVAFGSAVSGLPAWRQGHRSGRCPTASNRRRMLDQVAIVDERHRLAFVDAGRPAGDIAGDALAAVEDVELLDGRRVCGLTGERAQRGCLNAAAINRNCVMALIPALRPALRRAILSGARKSNTSARGVFRRGQGRSSERQASRRDRAPAPPARAASSRPSPGTATAGGVRLGLRRFIADPQRHTPGHPVHGVVERDENRQRESLRNGIEQQSDPHRDRLAGEHADQIDKQDFWCTTDESHRIAPVEVPGDCPRRRGSINKGGRSAAVADVARHCAALIPNFFA